MKNENHWHQDENHEHITTRDFRLITNTKVRNLLRKRSYYREENTINYSKCKIAIDSNIHNCREKLKIKYKLERMI